MPTSNYSKSAYLHKSHFMKWCEVKYDLVSEKFTLQVDLTRNKFQKHDNQGRNFELKLSNNLISIQ